MVSVLAVVPSTTKLVPLNEAPVTDVRLVSLVNRFPLAGFPCGVWLMSSTARTPLGMLVRYNVASSHAIGVPVMHTV